MAGQELAHRGMAGLQAVGGDPRTTPPSMLQ